MRHWIIKLLVFGSVGGAGALALWGLFGWSTLDNPTLGVFRYHRFFGRTTTIELDANRDGRADARVEYRWSAPYIGNINVPGGDTSYVVTVADQDLDGRWDTWVEPLGCRADNTCQFLWSADTTGDGAADWWRVASYDEAQEVEAALSRERGF